MKKYIPIVTFLVFGILSVHSVASQTSSIVPDPFKGFDADSRLRIDYSDLDSLLDAVVLNTGPSNRKKAEIPRSQTGTRMKIKINRATINEGNRFYFEVFQNNPDNQQTLYRIRSRLENIPAGTSLENFSRDEQLAYWINLYNVTLLEEIVKVYPERDLEDLLSGEDSILARKLLLVGGIPLSLNEIQFTILRQNYENDPLVIYGLYQGIIGGPNIRKSAYTGKYVYADLIDNAMNFVNSNRGTESKNSKVFRVSNLYERNKVFFPDFEADLTRHLLSYLEGEQHDELQAAKNIKTDISDWTVTDLFGNSRNLGASFANSNAALDGAVSGGRSSMLTNNSGAVSRYSPAVIQHLNELNRKRAEEREGTVTVEELGQASVESDAVERDESTRN